MAAKPTREIMLIHEDFPLHLPLSKIWSQRRGKKNQNAPQWSLSWWSRKTGQQREGSGRIGSPCSWVMKHWKQKLLCHCHKLTQVETQWANIPKLPTISWPRPNQAMEIRHMIMSSMQTPTPSDIKTVALSQVLRADLAVPTHSQILSLFQERVLTKPSHSIISKGKGSDALVVASGSCRSLVQFLPASPSRLDASQESHLLIADLPPPKWIQISQLTHSY